MFKRSKVIGTLVAVATAVGGLGIAGATGVPTAASGFTGINPVRVLDTRNGIGPQGAVGQGQSIIVTVAGANGIPSDATAVVLNVTAVDGTQGSFGQVWPTGSARPNASTLNWSNAGAVANGATVAVGTGGQVSFFNNGGSVNFVADVAGYYESLPAAPPPVTVPTTYPIPNTMIGSLPASSPNWEFAGTTTAQLTLSSTQRVTASSNAVLGQTAATATTAAIGVCEQAATNGTPSGSIMPLGGQANYVVTGIPGSSSTDYGVSETGVPGAGTFVFGYCVSSSKVLDRNDFAQGYVTVSAS